MTAMAKSMTCKRIVTLCAGGGAPGLCRLGAPAGKARSPAWAAPPGVEKFMNKLGDLIGIKPAQVKQHYRACLDIGSRSDKGHGCALHSACLVTACESEANVLDRVFGVRREYRFGRKKASETVELEEDCPRSGAFMYLGVCVGEHQLFPGTLRMYTFTPTT